MLRTTRPDPSDPIADMNLRLTLTRLLFLPVAGLILVSHHVYAEDGGIDTLLGASGLLLLIVAMGGRIWASVYLVGRKNQVLVTEGPFSLVRNPLYLFSLIGFVGAGLAFESLALAAIFAVIFFLAHWPAIHREEETLRGIFGKDFEAYRRQVPRLLPRMGPLRRGTSVELDPRRFAIALRDCLAIPLVVIVAEALEWAKLSGVLPVLVELP